MTGRIDEVDVVKVRRCQPVRISGDAFPGLELKGRIARISAESRTTGGSRLPTFDVTADVEPPGDEHLERLRLGMTTNVTLVVREESAALLVPMVAVHGRMGAFGNPQGSQALENTSAPGTPKNTDRMYAMAQPFRSLPSCAIHSAPAIGIRRSHGMP